MQKHAKIELQVWTFSSQTSDEQIRYQQHRKIRWQKSWIQSKPGSGSDWTRMECCTCWWKWSGGLKQSKVTSSLLCSSRMIQKLGRTSYKQKMYPLLLRSKSLIWIGDPLQFACNLTKFLKIVVKLDFVKLTLPSKVELDPLIHKTTQLPFFQATAMVKWLSLIFWKFLSCSPHFSLSPKNFQIFEN